MTLVDDQGRLFGRWNVVDGLIGVVLLGLIPLLYGAYLLFRPSMASLTSIEPARIFAGDGEITVRGNNLRPYMRVSFGSKQGATYLFEDPTKAVVQVAGLAAGVYDVILYDQAQERARIPNALEVVALPRPEVQLDVIGSFTGVPDVLVQQLKPGVRLDGLGELLRLGTAVPAATRTLLGPGLLLDIPSTGMFNVPAVVRSPCTLVQRNSVVNCMTAADSALMEDVVLRTAVPAGSVFFQVDQLRTGAPETMITARVRFAGDRPVLDRMHEGDRDVRRQNEFAASAAIASMSAPRAAGTSVGVAIPSGPGMFHPYVATEIAFRDAVLRLPAQKVNGGWNYAARTLLLGGVLTFSGPGYQLPATILSIDAPPQ